VLSVRPFTDYDYPFGVFKLSQCLQLTAGFSMNDLVLLIVI